MSFLSKLFGGGGGNKPPEAEPEDYNGYTIFVEPMKEPDGYRVAARIEKEIGGALKSHHLIRADVSNNLDEAKQTSRMKAQQMIDQMGDMIFD